jgi:hypothetical protein
MTVKQLFEPYVYAEILSSIDLVPFVTTPLTGTAIFVVLPLWPSRHQPRQLIEHDP